MDKRAYLKALERMENEWILESLSNPSPAMRDIHLALHRIVLRKRGVLKK
jgi:hypothetical protein